MRAARLLMLTLSAAALASAPAQAQQVRRAPVQVDACAPCHGVDGIARDVEVPHLAGQNEAYLLNQLRAFRTGARKHKEMRYMSRHMTEQDFEALAAYYAALPRS
ncbi:c-type cytochrome [Alsobacter sp. KACC 23698]|uniref:C-type cytochrome n=1 Tax=Alsobacter sp. KACC 23698 TaxID=3149229 RepID=A0AAU7JLM0_9HYPH